jgi:poly-beta-1,6-N-acetyl-D-glucosamine biosynthesis protein PgaD
MGESGPGPPHPKIINRRDLKSRSRMVMESLITLAFWTSFIYLLIPLVTLCLWMFGVKIAYTELIGNRGLSAFIKIIKNSSTVVFYISLIILGWSYYNYFLFKIRGDRRNTRVMICYDEDFCALYHLDLETLHGAKEQRRLMVTLTGGRVEVQSAPGAAGLSKTPDLAAS